MGDRARGQADGQAEHGANTYLHTLYDDAGYDGNLYYTYISIALGQYVRWKGASQTRPPLGRNPLPRDP